MDLMRDSARSLGESELGRDLSADITHRECFPAVLAVCVLAIAAVCLVVLAVSAFTEAIR